MALSTKYLQHSYRVCNSTANFHVIIIILINQPRIAFAAR